MYHRFAFLLLVCTMLVANSQSAADAFKQSCSRKESSLIDRYAQAAFDSFANLDQEISCVLLNYLYIAGRSSRIERAVSERIATLQQTLFNAQAQEIGYAHIARLMANLAKLLEVKERHTMSLRAVEQYADGHADFQALLVKVAVEPLQDLLIQVYENRAVALDLLLEDSADKVSRNPFAAHGGLYRMLVQEPDLLLGDAVTPLAKIDRISATMRSLDHVLAAVTEVRDDLLAATYLSLEVSYLYFKALYARFHEQYRTTFGVEPQLLFAETGLLGQQDRIALPDMLGV